MGVLEELWYGNIYPSERPIQKGSGYAAALEKFNKEKETLLSGLSPEVHSIFEKLLDKKIDPNTVAEREAFVLGFRLAAQLLIDSLTDLSAP